jgi:threonine dehydratase
LKSKSDLQHREVKGLRQIEMTIELTDIKGAQKLLAAHFPPTRLLPTILRPDSKDVYLKLECELPTGSFKVRGALYSLSVNRKRREFDEVVAASTGNHGAAVAYAAHLFGIPAKIFLPRHPNSAKLERIVQLGASIVEAGEDLSAAIDTANEYAQRSHAFFLHDASDPDIPIGTGVIGLEIVEQLPSVETIYVPVGDSALIRGIASAVKSLQPNVRIVGVAAKGAPSYYFSWRAGKVVEAPFTGTIADGLAVSRPLQENVIAIRGLVDEMCLVSDEDLMETVKLLWSRQQVKAEPSAVAGLAACMNRPEASSPSAVIITGSNISPELASIAFGDAEMRGF